MSGQRIFTTADGRYVPEGDPDAVSLAFGEGDDPPAGVLSAVSRKVHSAEEEAARKEAARKAAATRAANKRAAQAENKMRRGSADK
jgi:hypothetical protein